MKRIFFSRHLILKLLSLTIVSGGCQQSGRLTDEKPDEGLPADSVHTYARKITFFSCSCEGERSDTGVFCTGEVLLFKDSIPISSERQIHKNQQDGQAQQWMVYESNSLKAWLVSAHGFMESHGMICNFPDSVNSLEIPQTGLLVYYEGKSYNTCTLLGGIPEIGYFDFILSSLKIK